MSRFRSKKRGFTLVELITVLAIMGVAMGVFYSVFFMNWQVFDQLIARADLGQDMDRVVDMVTADTRLAKTIVITPALTENRLALTDAGAVLIATYIMRNTGEFLVNRGQGEQVVTAHLDFANSSLTLGGFNGKALNVVLVLTEQFWGRTVSLSSSTEVYPRN